MISAVRKIRPAWDVGRGCVARIALAQSGAAFPDFARANPGYERTRAGLDDIAAYLHALDAQ
jgi:hypothetical protein